MFIPVLRRFKFFIWKHQCIESRRSLANLQATLAIENDPVDYMETNFSLQKRIAGSSIWFMAEEVSNKESVNVGEKNAFQFLMNNSTSLVRH